MDLEWAAIILIVLVAAIGILSYMWESLDRVQRLRFTDQMRALGDAVRNIRIGRVK